MDDVFPPFAWSGTECGFKTTRWAELFLPHPGNESFPASLRNSRLEGDGLPYKQMIGS